MLVDYKEFEEVVNYKVKFEGLVDFCFDFSQMVDLIIDVVWEEIKFLWVYVNDFKCVVVIIDSQWVIWSVWLLQIFVNVDVEVFVNIEEVRFWLDIVV